MKEQFPCCIRRPKPHPFLLIQFAKEWSCWEKRSPTETAMETGKLALKFRHDVLCLSASLLMRHSNIQTTNNNDIYYRQARLPVCPAICLFTYLYFFIYCPDFLYFSAMSPTLTCGPCLAINAPDHKQFNDRSLISLLFLVHSHIQGLGPH